jgi:thiamine pyrophosphate-dependent acetolactate synthase large subunit-like protein
MKLAHPDKTVVGFTGDGGSMYTIQALWTAAHHKVGAKVCYLQQPELSAAQAQYPPVLARARYT